MIRREEVYRIGIINRPHGVKGEVSFTFTDDVFDRTDAPYLILMIDGILVPFFIEEYRFRSDTAALVKFEDVDTTEQARALTNVEVYFPKRLADVQDALPGWDYFMDFQVEDVHHGILGKLTGVDDSTMNILLIITGGGREILLPAHEDFFVSVDKKERTLRVNVPEGLLDG